MAISQSVEYEKPNAIITCLCGHKYKVVVNGYRTGVYCNRINALSLDQAVTCPSCGRNFWVKRGQLIVQKA